MIIFSGLMSGRIKLGCTKYSNLMWFCWEMGIFGSFDKVDCLGKLVGTFNGGYLC